MDRELWLLRHGKAQRNLPVEDSRRPLTKRGKYAAHQVGMWLKQQLLIPDVLVTSPAIRAYDTAGIVLEELDAGGLRLQSDSRLYFQGVDTLKAVLADYPKSVKRVLMVGHNPDFEELLVYLVGAEKLPEADKLLPTAALARLAMPDDWHQLHLGCAQLLSLTYAKKLK
jgi:phosphohistidine phosphatase